MAKTKLVAGLLMTALALSAAAEDQLVVVATGDSPGVALLAPENARVSSYPNMAVVQTTNMFLIVRPIADAATPSEAALRAADLIKNEVAEFQATTTNEITIAGAPAIHLSGTGLEADDGDPAAAEIVFFACGGHVFSACVHGEGDEAEREREPMLSILLTAKTP